MIGDNLEKFVAKIATWTPEDFQRQDAKGRTVAHRACARGPNFLRALTARCRDRSVYNAEDRRGRRPINIVVNRYGDEVLMTMITELLTVLTAEDLEVNVLDRLNPLIGLMIDEQFDAAELLARRMSKFSEDESHVVLRMGCTVMNKIVLAKNPIALNLRCIDDDLCREIVLLRKFRRAPERTRWELGRELGFASEIFAIFVAVTDEYLRVISDDSDTQRFFNIAVKLPMDLQMVLSNRMCRSAKNIIGVAKTRIALDKFI